MREPELTGVARFVGSVPTDDGFMRLLMYGENLDLYHIDPPLRGYRVVAAGQKMWAMRAHYIDDPTPPDDPVSTVLFGTTGGEALRILWDETLLEAGGRAPARALTEAGYRVLH